IQILTPARTIVALGAFGWEGVLRALGALGLAARPRPVFRHAAEASVGGYRLIGTYHPSQQNTFTGKLTEPMLDAVLRRARSIAGLPIVAKSPGPRVRSAPPRDRLT